MSVSGFSIRSATIADAPAIAKVHVQAFKETHGAFRAPKLPLRLMQWTDLFAKNGGQWFCFVVERDAGESVGFAKGDFPESGTDGLLNKIYILRKFHKLGLGRWLLLSIAQEFQKHGVTSMHLFGEARNPSNGFYERMGAEKCLGDNGEFHGGYRWNDLSRLELRAGSER